MDYSDIKIKFIQNIKKALRKLNITWSFCIYYIQKFSLWIILLWMANILIQNLLGKDNFSQILTIYIAIIALSITISSAVFTYSRCNHKKKTENKLIKIGQLFLYASVSILKALLIGYLCFEINKELLQHSSFSDYTILSHLMNIIFLILIYIFFALSMFSFYKGLEKLEEHLFSKIKKDII